MPAGVAPFAFGRPAQVAFFSFVFLAYMISSSREIPWSDARPIYEVAESIVLRQSLNIETRWPAMLPNGRDGKIYAVAPILQSLVHVPGVVLAELVARIFAESPSRLRPFASHVGPAALGALTCLLFFRLCRRLGTRHRTAVIATALLAFGTTIWVYARSPYAEILQAACFTGFFSQTLVVRDSPIRRNALVLGLWAGLLMNAKIIYALSVLGAVVYLSWSLRSQRRRIGNVALYATFGALPWAGMLLAYNYVRWGSLDPGYTSWHNYKTFGENIFVGLWGTFLSPGKSVFLYSPPLILALVGLARAVRRWPSAVAAVLALAGPTVMANGALLFWAGDWAWGVRYFVFAVPVCLLLACPLLDEWDTQTARVRRRLASVGVGILFVMGAFVQLVGNAFYWDHYIRIAKEARERWLGNVDRQGAMHPIDLEGCGACFEDMHALQWMPPFQPIEGHWWLLRHVLAKDGWEQAEADAPWKRYTALQLHIGSTYPRARIDWWFVEETMRAKSRRLILAAMLVVLCLVGFWLGRQLARGRSHISGGTT